MRDSDGGECPRRVLLIGMMGAGKSTVGAALADRLGWPYLDSDTEIVRRRGMTVPEIWRSEGEPAFRAEEAAVLRAAVASAGPSVIAVAGGALLDPANRAAVTGAGLVVWLRAGVDTLADRVGAGEGRPLLDGDPRSALARLEAQRRPVYQATASVTLDVDGHVPGELVDVICGLLGPRPGRAHA